MDGFEKLHNDQDEFIKKTLQEDKIVSQPIFDNFSVYMDKTKVKVKRYSYKQQNIIVLLILLLAASVGLNIYLAVVKDTPITITNIFQPAQDYNYRPDISDYENTISNKVENVVENVVDNTIDKAINNTVDNTVTNTIKIDAIIPENTVSKNETNTSVQNVVASEKNEVSNTVASEPEKKEPEKVTPPKEYKEIDNAQIKAFVNQFAIGINKLNLQDSKNLESNTILLYIAQQYFSKQSNSSSSLSVSTDYASSNVNFHKFLSEFTANDYSKTDYIKSYNNYIGYISRSKAYVYGNDYSILAKEKYNCDSVTITNKENDIYTATAKVSRTYINDKKEEEKNGYEITFTFKVNNNYKYQKYKLLSFNSKLVSGDVETVIHLGGN